MSSMNCASPKETTTMLSRFLLVLCLTFLTLSTCVHAQPPVANDPQAVAQAFLKALLANPPEGGDRIMQEVVPLLVGLPEEHGPGLRPKQFEVVMMITWLQTICGAQALPQPALEGDHATVFFQPPPMPLVLIQVGGKWKVDVAATFKAMPEGVRKFAESEQRKAEQAACLDNLKQIALAAAMFAADHGNALPDADKWVDELAPYAKNEQIFRCPAAPNLEYGYAMSRALSGQWQDRILQPAVQVAFFETDLGTRNAAGGAEAVCKPGRHNGGNNFAFADGHALWWRGEGFPQPRDLQPPGPPPPPPAPGAGGPPPPAE